jgi:hypothetical protein
MAEPVRLEPEGIVISDWLQRELDAAPVDDNKSIAECIATARSSRRPEDCIAAAKAAYLAGDWRVGINLANYLRNMGDEGATAAAQDRCRWYVEAAGVFSQLPAKYGAQGSVEMCTKGSVQLLQELCPTESPSDLLEHAKSLSAAFAASPAASRALLARFGAVKVYRDVREMKSQAEKESKEGRPERVRQIMDEVVRLRYELDVAEGRPYASFGTQREEAYARWLEAVACEQAKSFLLDW